jgi:riboflavin kinase/FMN adenylyltransferase
MKVFRGLPDAGARLPCALTIGNFDGVHRGHQALLARMRDAATRLGVQTAVMTFEPHPREFFAALAGDPARAPRRIANLRDKLRSLAEAGVDRVIVEHFSAHFAAMPADEFIEKVLVQGLHVKWLIVGEDFCFGARRSGNIALLKQGGAALGFKVETLPTVMQDDVRISSSAVRAALAAGDFAAARQLLGHTYRISGRVMHGQKLGRTLGFPTLNLRIGHKRPAISGIFVVRVHGLADQPLAGVASMGVRPTVDDSGRVLLETNVFDFDRECYGELVQVEFLKKLRDEEHYPDLPTLKAAIASDADNARAWFAQHATAISATDRI